MSYRAVLSSALVHAACPGESPSAALRLAAGEVVVPATATIDGVLQMRHDSTAFAWAPQPWMASEPTLMLGDGGEPTST